jgi:hypothetical protein
MMKLERMLKQAAVANLKVLSEHLSGETEEGHQNIIERSCRGQS